MLRGTIAAWVFDNVPLPAFARPYVFGLIVGRWPHKNKYECIRCGGTGEEPEADEYEAALKELADLGQEYDKR